MKRKVLFGAALWTLFISAVHVSLNVGWQDFLRKLAFWRSQERAELVVGFLPVT